MFNLYVNGTPKLCIFKEGSNDRETKENIKKKVVANKNILIFSGIGAGKSVSTNSLADEFWKAGYTVIYMTEKEGSQYDNACCCLEPKEMYHLNLLNRQGRKPEIRKVKLYHPFTFNIGKLKRSNMRLIKQPMPPVIFYTFSIKSIMQEGWNALLFGDAEKMTVRSCKEIAKKLKPDETFWDLVNKLARQIENKDKEGFFDYDKSRLGVAVKPSAYKRTAEEVVDAFSILRDEYCVMPANHPMNIDFKKVIDDQEHWHFFSIEWQDDERIKFFTLINNLSLLAEAAKEAKHPIVIVLEELKGLLPELSKDEVGFERELVKLIRSQLSKLRARGKGTTVIGTTQVFKETNSKIRSVFTDFFIGSRLSTEDKKVLFKDYNFKTNQLTFLDSLNVGEWALWTSMNKGLTTRYIWNIPPFANAEEKDSFFKRFIDEHSDECVTYEQTYKDMLADRNANDEKAQINLKEYEIRYIEQQRRKKEARTKEKDHEKIEKVSEENKELIKKACYNMRKINPKTTWEEIGKEMKLSKTTVNSYSLEYAASIGDNEFQEINKVKPREVSKIDENVSETS